MLLTLLLSCHNDHYYYTEVQAQVQRLNAEQHFHSMQNLFPDLHLIDENRPNFRVSLVEEQSTYQYDSTLALQSPTPLAVDSLLETTVETVDRLLEQQPEILRCFEAEDCWNPWLKQVLQQAWRRPIQASEFDAILTQSQNWKQQFSAQESVAMTLSMILMAPDFYFIGLKDDPNFHVAEKLSFFLWNSIPDIALLQKAQNGELQDSRDIENVAFDMLRDERAFSGMQHFHHQWLQMQKLDESSIDLETYFPELYDMIGEEATAAYYSQQIKNAFEIESDVFFAYHSLYESHNLKGLLTTQSTFVNARLEEIYGVQGEGEAITHPLILGMELEPSFYLFRKAQLPGAKRAGFLTLPSILHMTSQPTLPSPIRRGLLVGNALLCFPLMTPPSSVPPLSDVEAEEPQTNRDRFAMHTNDPSCQSCHQSIDGLGFGFENYDVLGRWQDTENGYEIDASGWIYGTDVDFAYSGVPQLAWILSQSRQVHRCYTQHWLTHALGEEPSTELLTAFASQFWERDGDIPSLVVEIVKSPEFLEMSE